MKKQYAALARVSSREQEREGFSLEVQEDGFNNYATQNSGEIFKLVRIAETATKSEERKVFKELLSFVKKNAHRLDGLLFFKVDRAARNLFDYVELERLEEEYGVPVIYVTQPTENTPAGRMMRRTLANMATYYTEQQSLDVKDGLGRRVKEGHFVGKAPYGYVNVRHDGRSVVEVQPEHGPKIRLIFDLYAYEGHTLDSLVAHLFDNGIAYTQAASKFTRSKVHSILRDRSYIGEIPYKKKWLPGAHEPLVDRGTFDRVQVHMGEQKYQSHDLVFGCERIKCGHCGHPVTGEIKTKQTKKGPKQYIYYRCGKYNHQGHPRIRLREAELDGQVMSLFDRFRIKDDKVREWFDRVLRSRQQVQRRDAQEQSSEINRKLTSLRGQQDRLLNMRIAEEIDENVFSGKSQELRDRIVKLEYQLGSQNGSLSENGHIAAKAFELSQTLQDKWVKASIAEKRQLLHVTCLNFSLEGATLAPEIRKPFDVLAEGQSVLLSRGDRI